MLARQLKEKNSLKALNYEMKLILLNPSWH